MMRKWSLKAKTVTPMSNEELKEIREEMLKFLESIGFKVVRERDV